MCGGLNTLLWNYKIYGSMLRSIPFLTNKLFELKYLIKSTTHETSIYYLSCSRDKAGLPILFE